jgi:hypothetical protein
VSYTAFLVPGLVMMSVLQNAFANSSSSLVQSKIMGSLVFLLLTPLSHWSWFCRLRGFFHCARPAGGHWACLLIATTVGWHILLLWQSCVDRGVCRPRRGHAGRHWA